jgi:hypothetical protein
MRDAPRTTRICEAGTVLVPVTDPERAPGFHVGTRFVIVQPG